MYRRPVCHSAGRAILFPGNYNPIRLRSDRSAAGMLDVRVQAGHKNGKPTELCLDNLLDSLGAQVLATGQGYGENTYDSVCCALIGGEQDQYQGEITSRHPTNPPVCAMPRRIGY